MNALECTFEEIDPQIGRVNLAGRLDVPGVNEVQLKFTVLTSSRRRPVVVDMSEVTLITSIGVGLLLMNARTLKGHGCAMVLLNPQPKVAKVITMAALDELLPIEYDLTSALQRLNLQS